MSNGADFSAYHVPSEVFLNPSQRNVLGGSSDWLTWAMAGDKQHNMETRAIEASHVRHPLEIEDPRAPVRVLPGRSFSWLWRWRLRETTFGEPPKVARSAGISPISGARS
jgi:hypothetical protein